MVAAGDATALGVAYFFNPPLIVQHTTPFAQLEAPLSPRRLAAPPLYNHA